MRPAGPRSDPQRVGARPEAEVVEWLRAAGDSLAVAESCTGGWLGRDLTSVPGASTCFRGGVIAYADSAKRDLLSVSATTLASQGAVSEQAATEMAAGVRVALGAVWGLAITGIAGPGGGTPEKPVGTVCIAVAGPISLCRTWQFPGDREAVRRSAVSSALGLLLEALGSR